MYGTSPKLWMGYVSLCAIWGIKLREENTELCDVNTGGMLTLSLALPGLARNQLSGNQRTTEGRGWDEEAVGLKEPLCVIDRRLLRVWGSCECMLGV